ncbi:ribonuclease H-like domain-containing protein [Mycena pura]|uniref:Ribonuclease H-like domain-containing protein n=1 Tax=Mycena pura TaxID=153505 RepID=A0AAD6UPJ6_9AGAR|nr:ribonuclease H-like domain-containing protein [Mycena pura]
MAPSTLSGRFHRGEKQNSTYYKNYCKACVKAHMLTAGAPLDEILTRGPAFLAACEAIGSIMGRKDSWIAHLIGGRDIVACIHASAEAKADALAQRDASKKRTAPDTLCVAGPPAKRQQPSLQLTQSTLTGFRRNDMPYGSDEAALLQRQALRVIVSGGLPLGVFEDPEMQIFVHMLRTTAAAIVPTGKVAGGRLLNAAAVDVEALTIKALKGKSGGISTDGWKCKKKESVNALCANVDFKSHLIELIEVTSLSKDGPSLCEQFAGMIDRVEEKYGFTIIYFTTDADGGSKKGRKLLGLKRPYLILPSCWAHQLTTAQSHLIFGDYLKVHEMAATIAEDATSLISWINNHGKVRKIFDESQKTISQDRLGRSVILAYLVANLTRWTTHFVAFARLFLLRSPLQLAVLQSRSAIIAAEVGAATSTEGQRLKEDAERFCALIEDGSFWNGLEAVLGDLEPICLATNINQKDSTRLDQVLLTIAGIFLRFADHPEPEVKQAMLLRLEKRWKDCDQIVFILALVLNPFEKLSCFGPNANLNQLKCLNFLILLYRRMSDRPDNLDTPMQRKVHETAVSKAFMQYISGHPDPIRVWEALSGSSHLRELSEFAITILNIVANQAGCERTFSRTKIEQGERRGRLGLEKIGKRSKVKAQIHSEHVQQGLYKPRKGRNNHKATKTLLAVPRYRDLLDDQNDEDSSERGRALVSSREGWRTELAKFIGDAQDAERAAAVLDAELEDDTGDNLPRIPNRLPAWKPLTLQVLFGNAKDDSRLRTRTRKPSERVMQEEERLMEEFADAMEDSIPDDGAIEIDSDEEFRK